jgi:hypothetical protein
MKNRSGSDRHQSTAPQLRDAAGAIAIAALSFIAQDSERLARFLALSGIGPDSIREAAREPDFLAGVLDHLAGDETLLLAFAEQENIAPTEITRARDVLAGRHGNGDSL